MAELVFELKSQAMDLQLASLLPELPGLGSSEGLWPVIDYTSRPIQFGNNCGWFQNLLEGRFLFVIIQ